MSCLLYVICHPAVTRDYTYIIVVYRALSSRILKFLILFSCIHTNKLWYSCQLCPFYRGFWSWAFRGLRAIKNKNFFAQCHPWIPIPPNPRTISDGNVMVFLSILDFPILSLIHTNKFWSAVKRMPYLSLYSY